MNKFVGFVITVCTDCGTTHVSTDNTPVMPDVCTFCVQFNQD